MHELRKCSYPKFTLKKCVGRVRRRLREEAPNFTIENGLSHMCQRARFGVLEGIFSFTLHSPLLTASSQFL